MKYVNIFMLLSIIFVATSCKNDEKKQDAPAAVEAPKFKVTMSVIAEKDDDFCVLYTEDGSINFTEGVWQKVTGSTAEQNVEFSLPEEILPTQLRLDLGMNKEQEKIVLKSVVLEYKGKKRIITQSEISTLFRPDQNKCTYDVPTGTVTPIVKDGVRNNPSMYPQEANLQPEIEKLYR